MRVFRRSAGTLCTVPEEIVLFAMRLLYQSLGSIAFTKATYNTPYLLFYSQYTAAY